MYWVILLFITPAVSTGLIGISNILLTPGHLVGRQSCGTCGGTAQCCGTTCIDSDLDCCPDGAYYCNIVGAVCQPCPAGQTCIDDLGESAPWTCCPDNICTFIFSSGTAIVTSVGNGAPQTPLSSPAIQTSTFTPPTTAPPSSSPPPPPTTLTISPNPTTPSPSLSPTPDSPSHSPSQPTTLITPPLITPTITPSFSTSTKSTISKAPTQFSSGSVNSVKFITSITSVSTQSSYSRWDGSGPLLTGTCATPEFSLVDGAQTTSIFYIGVVGCVGGKTDCCPFQPSSTTVTVTAAGAPPPTTQNLFPSASTTGQNTLPDCPADYETLSLSYCCPSGYLLWNTELGGITPCYSTTANYLTPPPMAAASTTNTGPSTGPSIATSTVVNVVYAMNYPVKSRSGGLSKGADAGVGVGSAAAAVAAVSALLWFFLRRKRRNGEEGDGSPWSDRGRSQGDTGSSPSTGLRMIP